MHELSIARAVVATAERHAQGRPVAVVHLRVGALRQVVPGQLAFYWDVVTEGTRCAGSRLEQELVPARLRCEACGSAWVLTEPSFRCPGCGAAAADLLSGEELEIESIEVEEAACTG